MSKTSNIIIRVSDEEKQKAVEISTALGCKNLSQFFRNYINDLYYLMHPVNDSIDFDCIIKDLEQLYESERNALKKFTIKSKIITLNELKEQYQK